MKYLLPILLPLLMSPLAWADHPMPTHGLDGVILHTSFAHNYGDMLVKVEYKGKFYEPREAANAILPQIGWDVPEDRENLAMAWIEQVELADLTILRKVPDDFPASQFHTPKVQRFTDGSVEVTVWVKEPIGMVPVDQYRQLHFEINADGQLKADTVTRVDIPM